MFLFKFIKNLIKTVLILAMVIVLIAVGGYILMRSKLNVDVYGVIECVVDLNEEVQGSDLCPMAFTSEDMQEAMLQVNGSVPDMITHTEDNGYNIKLNELTAMGNDYVMLSDKQLGAVAQQIVKQQGSESQFEIKQIDISNIKHGNADFNIVVKLKTESFLGGGTEDVAFPFSLILKKLPEDLWISSTVRVEKQAGFEYSLLHRSITFNNLTDSQTAELLNMMGSMGSGSDSENSDINFAEEFNLSIAEQVFDALVGNENKKGFVYSLKDLGVTNFGFTENEGIQYFVVEKA